MYIFLRSAMQLNGTKLIRFSHQDKTALRESLSLYTDFLGLPGQASKERDDIQPISRRLLVDREKELHACSE